MSRVASPATQEAGVVPELCRASWLLPFSRKLKTETRLKPPATPALVPYHVHGGIALVTLVRSLATSCYFDFIDLKKKKGDVREVREVAQSHTAGNRAYIGPQVCLVICYSYLVMHNLTQLQVSVCAQASWPKMRK